MIRSKFPLLNAADGALLATGETMHAWTDRALKPVNAKKTVPDVYSILSREVKPEEDEM